jgi:hypothetical protein
VVRKAKLTTAPRESFPTAGRRALARLRRRIELEWTPRTLKRRITIERRGRTTGVRSRSHRSALKNTRPTYGRHSKFCASRQSRPTVGPSLHHTSCAPTQHPLDVGSSSHGGPAVRKNICRIGSSSVRSLLTLAALLSATFGLSQVKLSSLGSSPTPSAEDDRARMPAFQSDAVRVRARQSYGHLPLQFEANYGQSDPRVKFLSRGTDYTLLLTSNEAALVFTKLSHETSTKPGRRRTARENKRRSPGPFSARG